jgi:pectate lyase
VAKDNVIQYSGRLNGGDFNWTFNDLVDDTDSNVNTALKSALTNYTTAMIYVQGEEIPSSQTLVVTTSNASQEVVEGNAIDPIIFTWGGDATNANVSGLPASGLNFVKDGINKTITITGTPTANVTYTIFTSGTVGTSVSISGTITVIPPGSASDEIHNFTESHLSSTFFTFENASESNIKGTVIYNGLTLTWCLKIESTTKISFTTVDESTLTLVFNDTFNGRIKIDGTDYYATNGILTLTLSSGNHQITKTDVANLYYISVIYNSLGINDYIKPELKLYPNPVFKNLNISSNGNIDKVEIYDMLGKKVKSIGNTLESIDLSQLSKGSYLIKVYLEQDVLNKIIIKN